MNPYTGRSLQGGCLIGLMAAILGMAFFTASSPNPVEVLKSGSMLAKIVVVVLAVVLVVSLMQYIWIGLFRRHIMVTGGRRSADDVPCAACGRPLLMFAPTYGTPRRCPNPACQTRSKWWHSGPECHGKGLSGTALRQATQPCPDCRSPESNLQDFLNDINGPFG